MTQKSMDGTAGAPEASAQGVTLRIPTHMTDRRTRCSCTFTDILQYWHSLGCLHVASYELVKREGPCVFW